MAGTLVAVLLLATLAGRAGGDAALTTADVVRFLRAGIGERTILTELGERGFGETLDEAHEAELRAAGASETLVAAVHRAAPATKASAAPLVSPAPEKHRLEASPHEATFAVGTRAVRVPVSVLDRTGRPLLGLQSADFQVSDDGQRQAVTLFSAERHPLRLALALDISRSMEGKIRQVSAASGPLPTAPPTDRPRTRHRTRSFMRTSGETLFALDRRNQRSLSSTRVTTRHFLDRKAAASVHSDSTTVQRS